MEFSIALLSNNLIELSVEMELNDDSVLRQTAILEPDDLREIMSQMERVLEKIEKSYS